MRKYRFFLFLSVIFLSGCLQQSPEELERLVKEDPSFKQMIAARDQARAQIQLIKQDLLSRKKQADEQTGKIRADYDASARQQNKKIEQLRGAVEQNRERLRTEMERQSDALAEKQNELDGYKKTQVDVRKVLDESKGITLSKAEKQRWEEHMMMLSEKMRPLAEEIQDLKLQIRLKKQKIQYLR